ncbi:DUF4918 family protein [Fulvivirga sp. M361]|uniref:uracil-DNA glycosylase family protein n=1 Tax=Fulvivirga sp. M361 TaxID=2594266 RepID=UPI001179DAB1|nr:uracil-DNA glycosylase family protein [Fulvivirga sp. M361]TRX58610.1 DUF4918 family protein [Fulvivirga sp. M361]
MNFGEKIIEYYKTLKQPNGLPNGVEILYPFGEMEVITLVEQFYRRFYSDQKERTFLIGINPGRLGGGSTGIPFTDPVRLEEDLSIPNTMPKKSELSSRFVYEMIHTLCGPDEFYNRFYITSVCPLGFVMDGKNLNYYDIKELQEILEPYMVAELKKQIAFGAAPVAYSLGMGKNITYLHKINKKHQLFETIEPLPHPRWIMQYRLKRKEEFIHLYNEKLMGTH